MPNTYYKSSLYKSLITTNKSPVRYRGLTPIYLIYGIYPLQMMRGKVERDARNSGSKSAVCEGEVCGGVENGGLGLAGFAEDL